jgi:hypothetical protein
VPVFRVVSRKMIQARCSNNRIITLGSKPFLNVFELLRSEALQCALGD